jgi:hypothetical protein
MQATPFDHEAHVEALQGSHPMHQLNHSREGKRARLAARRPSTSRPCMKSPQTGYLLSRGLPPEWARSAPTRIYYCREGCCGRQLHRLRWWRLSYGQRDDTFGGCNHALAMMQTSASGTTSSLGLDLLLKRAQKLLGIEMVSPGLEMVRFGFFLVYL